MLSQQAKQDLVALLSQCESEGGWQEDPYLTIAALMEKPRRGRAADGVGALAAKIMGGTEAMVPGTVAF